MGERLVLATDRAVPGGAQLALAHLGKAMVAHGWSVQALVAERGPLVERLAADQVPVTVSSDAAALADLDADVLVSMGASGHAWAGPTAVEAEVDATWWLDLTLRGRPTEATALAVPARLVAVPTRAAAAAMRARSPSLAVEVIAPGADAGPAAAHRLQVAAVRDQVGIAPTDPTALLVSVARLDPIKGQDVAIAATAALVVAGRDVHLALVGGAVVGHEGDLEHRLRERARTLGIAELVTFVGHLDDPGPWHAAADVAVQASRHEVFGLSVVESLAHGVPVVASDTDGPRSILDDGRFGLLTEPGDAEALAAGIARILDDPALRRRLADGGPARAAAFTPEAAAARWDAALRGVHRTRRAAQS